MSEQELLARLRANLNVRLGEPMLARDAVNQPMIRHWCDALDDRNPVYTDPELAARSLHGGIVAPPTMLQAWTMPGLVPKEVREARSAAGIFGALRLLDEAGFTSVVATNCTQEYQRYLRPGDLAQLRDRDRGRLRREADGARPRPLRHPAHAYRDQHGELVASMSFRLLKFRPPRARARRARGAGRDAAAAEGRVTHDNRFFWEGVAQRELRIQRCNACQRLQHPPGPMCSGCHGLDLGFVRSQGRGSVYSFVVRAPPGGAGVRACRT